MSPMNLLVVLGLWIWSEIRCACGFHSHRITPWCRRCFKRVGM